METTSIANPPLALMRTTSDAAGNVGRAAVPHPGNGMADLQRGLVDALRGSDPRIAEIQQVDVQFQVDTEIDRVIARIVDSNTGAVVREVPSDELVDLARRLTALIGAMVDRRV